MNRYLLDVNHTFATQFTLVDVWDNINKYCINARVMKRMIQTNLKGFGYASIGDKKVYYDTIVAVCRHENGYTKANAIDSQQMQCFQLLLAQPQIQDILKDDNRKIIQILQILIATDKDALIEYLFDFVKKCGWKNVNFCAPMGEGHNNALTYSIHFGNVCVIC